MGSDRLVPPAFALNVTESDDRRTTVAVSGELDIATAEELFSAVRDALAAGSVLVDLGDVTFMDSAGVLAINRLLRAASEHESELKISRTMTGNVEQVLAMTGMLQQLPLEERP